MAAESSSGADFWVGDWLVRPSLAKIVRGAEAVHVTPRSMAVLMHLAHAGGRVVSRNEILDAVWPNMAVTHDALSQCIVELRKAFRDDSRRAAVIETIPKVGVRLIAPVAFADTPVAAVSEMPGVSGGDGARIQPVAPETGRDTPSRAAALAVRVASSPAAAATALVMAALGSAAFWWTGQSHLPFRDPLAGADFTRVTDFIGAEEHAAISRDGRLVAFVSDRDGAWDIFVGQIGSGDFQNLTKGAVPELRNPAVRMVDFSPAGSDVLIWTKTTDATGAVVDHGWKVPVLGGSLRPYLNGVAEVDWSSDGERIVYHPSAPGDPLFVTSAEEGSGGKQIYIAPPGIHCHFPLWSPDGENIFFVQGFVPDEMDLWRISASGGKPERLTWHNSRVSFPTLIDKQTLLYLATAPDGSGPWLHSLDLERGDSHRIKSASNQYTSISASADGRRLVAAEAHPIAGLWRVPLSSGVTSAAEATQIPIHTQRGVSPRVGSDFIVYRAPKAGTDGLWRHEGDAAAKELWSGVDGRVVGGPALSADGQRVAFAVQRRGSTQLYVINSDGSDAHRVAAELDVRGAPAWSPVGDWLAIAAMRDGEPRLFKIPIKQGGAPIALGDDYALDPIWSPSGQFIIYTGRDVGTTFEIKAVNADGAPHALPRLFLNRGSRRLDFLGENEDALVTLQGALSNKEFWVIDLRTGEKRALTELGAGPLIGDFDVSRDGSEIVFDRVREQSDIVLIDLGR
jgi:DNA-binding winged helix-turn-helix (wHTH) protein/Tol biopolymer transport system component